MSDRESMSQDAARKELLARLLAKEGASTSRPPRIGRREDPGERPLSFNQQRLWFLDRLQPGSAAYNLFFVERLVGDLAPAVLRSALADVIRRHEVLRTTFPETAGVPYQRVDPPAPPALPRIDLAGLPSDRRPGELEELVRAEARRPFDLAAGPLLRAALIRLGPREHAVFLAMHHIISDAWSRNILVREMAQAYRARLTDGVPRLPDLPIQYTDYAAWQRRAFEGAELGEQLRYWSEQLDGLPVLQLPTDRPRGPVLRSRGARIQFELPPELVERLDALGRAHRATLFMVLLSAFQALLARWSGQLDVAVGTPVAGRGAVEVEPLVGFFVNTLVLRADLSGDPAFDELLGRVRETTVEAFSRQELPFERLVEELRPERTLSHNPLFQVVFALEHTEPTEVQVSGLTLSPLVVDDGSAKFDLTLNMVRSGRRLGGSLEFATDLFDGTTARRLARHYQTLLAAIARAPERSLGRRELLDPAERHQVLIEWDGGAPPPAGAECVHRRFAAWAQDRPDAVALVSDGRHLSYGALARRSGRLARDLRARGVGPEVRVALCLERGPEMVVAVLGVLAAGGAYVPLDPALPTERLRFVLEDSGVAAVVVPDTLDERIRSVTEALRPERLGLTATDGSGGPSPPGGPRAPQWLGSPDAAAYVIYTSGSTGRPKGVVVEHRQVARLFDATRRWFDFGADETWSLFHSFAFDFSVWELWGALAHGGRLLLVPYLSSRDPLAVVRLLARERVTSLSQTPSAFRQLVAAEGSEGEASLSLAHVVFGGEALELETLRPWLERHGDREPRLINMYGITETTVHVTYRPIIREDVEGGRGSVVGRAIPDLSVDLLDPDLRPVPIGVAGEICVGGASLARGYLGRPGLTAERFVPRPAGGGVGERLYRSGDLGRRLPDGDLEYLGRIDQQVKVRGFRIELGEIESVLDAHPAVRESVVSARRDEREASSDRLLVAYLVPGEGHAPTVDELREHLQRSLPDYMVPALFVVLDELPMTPNGKVDRRALPAPEGDRAASGAPYVAPRSPEEEILASIWERILGVDRVGTRDNFFALGGDSILSIRVLAEARDAGIELTLEQLFQHQTIGRLVRETSAPADTVAVLEASRPFDMISADDRERLPDGIEDAYPLTRLQAGMIYHMELQPEHPLFHNVNSWHFRGRFEPETFREAVRRSVARHPVLRTSFDLSRYSEPLQLVHSDVPIRVEVEDLRHLEPAAQEEAVRRRVRTEAGERFDLGCPPLFRFSVQRRGDDTFQLVLAENHAILDGWSLHLTLAEIAETYFRLLDGEDVAEPAPPAVSFRDFVELERHALDSSECRSYWKRVLDGMRTTELPRWPDALRTQGGPRMKSVDVAISDDVYAGLRGLARAASTPLKSVLLAAHLQVMARVSGRSDVVTGLACNGRLEVADGDRVRGLFLNTVPFRFDLAPFQATEASGDRPEAFGAELARRVFRSERELLPFRRFPLSTLQEMHGARNLFEVSFNFTHFHVIDGVLERGGLGMLQGSERMEQTNFTLSATFNLDPSAAVLALHLRCDRSELCEPQIHDLIGAYLETLVALAAEGGAEREEELGAESQAALAGRAALADRRTGLSAAVELIGEPHLGALARAVASTARGRRLRSAEAAALSVVDLGGLPEPDRARARAEALTAEAERPFEPGAASLLRATVLRLGEERCVLSVAADPLAVGAWTVKGILHEILFRREAERTGGSTPFEEWADRHRDLEVPRPLLAGGVLARHLEYWERRLGGTLPVLDLPGRRGPASGGVPETQSRRELSADLSEALEELADREGVTLYVVLLAAWMTLLHLQTEERDLPVGIEVGAGGRVELEPLLGCLSDLRLLRVDVADNPPFRELLHRVRDRVAEAHAYHELPFPFRSLVDELQQERCRRAEPPVQTAFLLHHSPRQAVDLPEGDVELAARPGDSPELELLVRAVVMDDGLATTWHFPSSRFDPVAIDRLASRFATLLESVVSEPGARLRRLQMYSEDELRELRQRQQKRKKRKFRRLLEVEPRSVAAPDEDRAGKHEGVEDGR